MAEIVGWRVGDRSNAAYAVFEPCDDASALLDMHDQDHDKVVFATTREECLAEALRRWPDEAENYGRVRSGNGYGNLHDTYVAVWHEPVYRPHHGGDLRPIDCYNIGKLIEARGKALVPYAETGNVRTLLEYCTDCACRRLSYHSILFRDARRREAMNRRLESNGRPLERSNFAGFTKAMCLLCSWPKTDQIPTLLEEVGKELGDGEAPLALRMYLMGLTVVAGKNRLPDPILEKVNRWLDRRNRWASAPR